MSKKKKMASESMNDFEFPEDLEFFKDYLLDNPKERFENYLTMFDFRPNAVKRREFNNNRNRLLAELVKRQGRACMLNFEACDPNAKLVIDHLIPLSTNKLNMELRQMASEPGKKVKAQNFGSNHPDNLILACEKCNNYKKHKLLNRSQLQKILSVKRQTGFC